MNTYLQRFKTIQQRITEGSMPEPNTGCWFWLGDKVKGGYGRIGIGYSKQLAHRASYEAFIGKIPEGLTIDHLCKQPCCVNPKHLEPVTMKENTMRGTSFSRINAEKIICSRGHEYNLENTYYYKDGRRDCKICMKIRYKYVKKKDRL